MDTELKEHLTAAGTWQRGFFMALVALFYAMALGVIVVVMLFQYFSLLFTGKRNPRLLRFGADLATFGYQGLRYLTFGSDTRPFPFAPWPGEAVPAPKAGTATKRVRRPAAKRKTSAVAPKGPAPQAESAEGQAG